MEHVWSVLCRRAITDKETNQMTLVDSIEHIGVTLDSDQPLTAHDEDPERKIGIKLEATLISYWVRSENDAPEKGICRVSLLGPNRVTIGREMTMAIDLTKKRRMRTQLTLEGLPFTGLGRYNFLVEMEDADGDWKTAARVPYEVELDPSSSAVQPTLAAQPQKRKRKKQ